MTNRGSLEPFDLEKIRKVRTDVYHNLHSDYSLYLSTPHWKNTRKAFFNSKLFKNKCFVCNGRFSTYQIHHKSYRKLGEEPLNHLLAVCDICHGAIHNLLKTLGNDQLWNVANKLKKTTPKKQKKTKKRKQEPKKPKLEPNTIKGSCSILKPLLVFPDRKQVARKGKRYFYCVKCEGWHFGRPKYPD